MYNVKKRSRRLPKRFYIMSRDKYNSKLDHRYNHARHLACFSTMISVCHLPQTSSPGSIQEMERQRSGWYKLRGMWGR